MLQFGLIGKPLKHSRSAILFAERFKQLAIEAQYHLYELEKIEELTALIIGENNLIGLNVTAPYKELVLPYCDTLSPEVQKIGAANTLLIKRSNHDIEIEAHNTDVTGFGLSLAPHYFSYSESQLALILGTGGAAKAVRYALEQRNIRSIMVSRNPSKDTVGYDDLAHLIPHATLIVNATPIGYTSCVSLPVPYALISNKHLCYDLIYNPEHTQFLLHAQRHGAQIMNGMRMLELQAEASWQIWNNYLELNPSL